MNFLSRRMWLLAGVTAMFASGALGVACSSNNGTGDGGTDSGHPGDATVDQQSTNDGGNTNKDGGTDGGNPTQSCEAGLPGTCDIVAQDCPQGQWCAVVASDGGGSVTGCIPVGTGSFPEGTACSTTDQCVAGLECYEGRCAKHCCAGDDSACGTAKPEGYAGHCNLVIQVDGNPAFSVCTYSATCEPFGVQACASGQTCIVKDVNGTASCTDFSGADAGAGAPCTYANDCNKDGLVCVGNLDGGAGSFCVWSCYAPPGPFDAGIASLPPGQGGCPSGETCKYGLQNAPSWYHLCGK